MPRTPPPDLPYMLLDGRIVYIGMFVKLMYLQWLDPKEPVYIYINSTGTTRDDGETVISRCSYCEISASSDFSIDNFVVDNKNAPRYDAMILKLSLNKFLFALLFCIDQNWLLQPFLTELVVYLWKEQPRHEVPPTFRRVLSSRLRRLAAQGKLPKVSISKHVSL
ncbi:BnaA07g04610D [Brassica napus]|uniref:BnaA07g04610D protein n=1 Tax=Brassica napus TaxID=3708 RepID=A0A078GR22_BRANA|nr:BnaA07g04610D [Brassica napus]